MTNPLYFHNNPETSYIQKPTSPTKKDQVQAIVEIILSMFSKRLHKNGNVYLVDNVSRAVFYIDDEAIFNTMASQAFYQRNIVISNSAIQTAKRILKDKNEATPSVTCLRVGMDPHYYWIDFADGLNYIAYSSAGAYYVGPAYEPALIPDTDFFRPSNLKTISPPTYNPRPTPPSMRSDTREEPRCQWLSRQYPNLDRLLGLTNVPEIYFSTIITWMVCALLPDEDQRLLEITGDEQSGKSTTAWIIKNLIDPTEKPLNETPNSIRDLLSIAQTNHIIAIDNADDLTRSLST